MKKQERALYSEEHKKYLKNIKIKKVLILSAQFGILIGILVLWETLTHFMILDPLFFSSPSRLIKTAIDMFATKEIYDHISVTVYECVLGFGISTIVGALIAIGLWWSDYLRRVIDPYLVILNSLPKIALGPVIIVLMGLGIKAIVTMAILICIIITITSVLNGMMSCDPDKILLMKSMGASKFQILYKLLWPYSIPNLISVLKINIGLSWIGTIMGEYLTSRAGLGYLIVYGGQVFKMDLVMTSVFLLCVMAAGMYLLVSLIEKRVYKSR
ncbi:MAG TPA: ABC transporter permease [Clostridiales bacterium]|nr:ABC transporter permease [Clostridiales bacterium]